MEKTDLGEGWAGVVRSIALKRRRKEGWEKWEVGREKREKEDLSEEK